MPTLKKLVSIVKNHFNQFLINRIKISNLSVIDYVEKEAERRSKFWREEKDELAVALQKMHQQNSINLNKARDLEAVLNNSPTKKMIFDAHLKHLTDTGELTFDSGSSITYDNTNNEKFMFSHNGSMKETSTTAKPLLTEEELEFIFSVSSEGFILGGGK